MSVRTNSKGEQYYLINIELPANTYHKFANYQQQTELSKKVIVDKALQNYLQQIQVN